MAILADACQRQSFSICCLIIPALLLSSGPAVTASENGSQWALKCMDNMYSGHLAHRQIFLSHKIIDSIFKLPWMPRK